MKKLGRNSCGTHVCACILDTMSTRVAVSIVALLFLLLASGYIAYEYVKRNPPDFVTKIVTSMAPPKPLPQGQRAPLVSPEGFNATIFARDLPGVRVLARDPNGVMLASLTQAGSIVALPDEDQDGQADQTVTVLEGLRQPHGIAFLCAEEGVCTLYVAETDAVAAYAYDPQTFSANKREVLTTLPSGDGHYTRTLLLDESQNRLLVSVGSSCNVCYEEDARRASVQAIDLETGTVTPFATGLRNTVFMTIHPQTGEVWGTDNGRDLLGDDVPPDEINILREGGDYGWPLCYGKNIHDSDFDTNQYVRNPCEDKVPSHIDLPAHVAALGLNFIPANWGGEFQGDLLVALHGSWNRSTPSGYKVARIPLDAQGNQEGEIVDFLTGFLPEGSEDTDAAIGRPVAVLTEEDGVVYISDDRAGAIYRIDQISQ